MSAEDWVGGPTLADLKTDLSIPVDDVRDDTALTQDLDAAVDFVMDRRKDLDYADDVLSARRRPNSTETLGTIRLAGRWFARRRSPDGLISAGEMGQARIPGVDADIERQLRIGRYRRTAIA